MGGRKCCVLPIQLQLMAMQCKIVIREGSTKENLGSGDLKSIESSQRMRVEKFVYFN